MNPRSSTDTARERQLVHTMLLTLNNCISKESYLTNDLNPRTTGSKSGVLKCCPVVPESELSSFMCKCSPYMCENSITERDQQKETLQHGRCSRADRPTPSIQQQQSLTLASVKTERKHDLIKIAE